MLDIVHTDDNSQSNRPLSLSLSLSVCLSCAYQGGFGN